MKLICKRFEPPVKPVENIKSQELFNFESLHRSKNNRHLSFKNPDEIN